MAEPNRINPEATCERCGADGAYAFGDRHICLGCYTGASACCAESDMEEVQLDLPECRRKPAPTQAIA